MKPAIAVTDKGIGIAEMPEKHPWFEYHSEAWYKHYCETHNYVSPELEWEVDIGNYENAVKQAIASAPLFEDQERVEEILGEQCREFKKDNSSYGASIHLKHGTYPIPPDFPEYVGVRQVWFEKTGWTDVIYVEPKQTSRTILRFVDKQEQRNHLVELMKEDEKHGMYEKEENTGGVVGDRWGYH